MRHGLFLALLILGFLASGCVSKPSDGQAPPAPAEDGLEELPEVGEVTEDELTPEPDLDINDTVDLGSLL
jgi:hypothetical protein